MPTQCAKGVAHTGARIKGTNNFRGGENIWKNATHENNSDIDADYLCEEILHCQPFISNFNNDVHMIIQYIYSNDLQFIQTLQLLFGSFCQYL